MRLRGKPRAGAVDREGDAGRQETRQERSAFRPRLEALSQSGPSALEEQGCSLLRMRMRLRVLAPHRRNEPIASEKSETRSKGRSQMPASPTQGIGVLSSISFSGTGLADAFLKGLGREVYLNVKDNRGYDAKSLNEALQALNNDI